MKIVFAIIPLFIAASAHAVMMGFKEVEVVFTNSLESITNAMWSDPKDSYISAKGFGWDGPTNAYRDFWIQSVPVAIGTSWRPARSVNVVIETDSKATGFSTLFVRYSPDKKNWSSWQALEDSKALIAVPGSASAEYDNFLGQYSKMNVPWNSDEEAAVKWILREHPDFFEKHQPFVGYVQFRVEGSIPCGLRIQKIKMQLNWMIGGKHTAPRDPNAEKDRYGAWRFEAP
jgi:hypothetical protein